MQLKQVFQTPDGQTFDNRADANDHIRRPKILEALLKLTDGNADLSNWLIDNRETVEVAFETGTIKRVTKSEGKKLAASLAVIKELFEAGDKRLAFVAENIGAVQDSFRWPSVKRMDDAEKATAARNTIAAAAEGNEELATWVVSQKDSILEAYQAGVEKRVVNQKAQDGLAAYREKKAAEKAAAEAAAAGGSTEGGEAAASTQE